MIEIDTGIDHGTCAYETEAEVLACLALARLAPDRVKIVQDVSECTSLGSW